ncbi:MAG: DUF411 domain-containing protein [Gammaproteobacteria bacterium]|nr:DUF411 domain-containing protein [Gammaproteobacteria bacterium]MDH4316732.1 DUF411 domain-containing protein [Gammaproteobacteria bacterium]MDH5501842.1 DUF411 domain-containing protein [Gammaproteobacteria bacterium]
MIRNLLVLALAAVLLQPGLVASEEKSPAKNETTVGDNERHVRMHKNPGCGCCDLWAEHLRQHGFSVAVTEDPKVYDLKESSGIPQPLHSCHTAFVGKYFVEGHVPAKDILSLLRLKPQGVTGIAVPGMPLGSPGMEHPRPQSFNTIALTSDGSAYVFAKHEAGEDFSNGE